MHSLLHSLHIGTLATWLSVVGFGTVAVIVKPRPPEIRPIPVGETLLIDEDFTLGDAGASSPPTQTSPAAPSATLPETLDAPPEAPPIADFPPLPEIPEFPAAEPSRERPAAQARTQPRSPTSRGGTSPAAKPAASGAAGKPGSGNSSSPLSNASRVAAGRFPRPQYPGEAIRRQQTATVLVTFTIGTDGRVISAYASKPCPHPLLNNAAVAAARMAKFPPGPVYTPPPKPYVFKLR